MYGIWGEAGVLRSPGGQNGGIYGLSVVLTDALQ